MAKSKTISTAKKPATESRNDTMGKLQELFENRLKDSIMLKMHW